METAKKKNPAIFAALINVIPGAINSVAKIFTDKKKRKENELLVPPFVEDVAGIANGLTLSSKSVVGYGLGGVIVMFAMKLDLTQTHNLVVFCSGVFLVAVTTIAKAFERNPS